MSFTEKIQNIISAFEKDNYSIFQGNRDKGLAFLQKQLETFPEYANTVIQQQILMPIWKVQCDAEEYIEKTQTIDRSRRTQHNCAINSFNILNRICDKLGIEPFSTVDTANRTAVSNEVGQFVQELYQTGTDPTFDGITYNRHENYKQEKIKDRIKEMERRLNLPEQKVEDEPQP